MRVFLFTLMSVVCVTAFAATVYRWVDENGVVHYSDQPHENAEKVQVAAPQTYKAPPTATAPANRVASQQAQASSNTVNCEVTSPADDETFPNTYSVTTSVQVAPPTNGAQVVLLMDGAQIANLPSGGGSYTIDPIDRGQHTLQAVVRDSSGKTVCQSANVTFTVLQPSVLNPASPNFKH